MFSHFRHSTPLAYATRVLSLLVFASSPFCLSQNFFCFCLHSACVVTLTYHRSLFCLSISPSTLFPSVTHWLIYSLRVLDGSAASSTSPSPLPSPSISLLPPLNKRPSTHHCTNHPPSTATTLFVTYPVFTIHRTVSATSSVVPNLPTGILAANPPPSSCPGNIFVP